MDWWMRIFGLVLWNDFFPKTSFAGALFCVGLRNVGGVGIWECRHAQVGAQKWHIDSERVGQF